MVMDPYAFWDRQIKFSCPGLSWNSILGSFTVMVRPAGALLARLLRGRRGGGGGC
jgi:hypothetical protein